MFALKLLAPYFAVAGLWVLVGNGWLAILGYHAQIVFWLVRTPPRGLDLRVSRVALLALPSALAGPALYFLLPAITTVDVSAWLSGRGLSGTALVAMVLYFGVVHPPLEQLHWAPLRERTWLAHILFAGYHVIVLYSLLPPLWLAACFAVLVATSVMWQQMERGSGGILVPVASHILADLGIVVAAFLLA